MDLGGFLRRARKRQGIGLREFARLHGRSHSYIGNVELGKVSPSLEQIQELSKIYGVEPWEAVAGMTKTDLVRQLLGPVPLENPDVQEILRLAAKPEGLEEIGHMLRIHKESPSKLKDTLEVIRAMRKIGMIKG